MIQTGNKLLIRGIAAKSVIFFKDNTIWEFFSIINQYQQILLLIMRTGIRTSRGMLLRRKT